MTSTLVLGLIGASVIVVLLFEMLRRQRLREKHALIWMLVALGTVVLAVFPSVLTWVADLVGVRVPSNLLFFAASMLLLLLTIQHSYEIGRLEDRTRTLAEEVALLRLEHDEVLRAVRDEPGAARPTAREGGPGHLGSGDTG